MKPTSPFLITKHIFTSTSSFTEFQSLISMFHCCVNAFDFKASDHCPICVGVCKSFLEGFLCRPTLPHQTCSSTSGDSIFPFPPLELFSWSDSTARDNSQTMIRAVERCVPRHHEDMSTWFGLGVYQAIATSPPRVHQSAQAEIVLNHMFRHKR